MSATYRDVADLLKTGSVKAMAKTLNMNAPVSLLALLRKVILLAQPRTPENLTPNTTNVPVTNLVLRWSDPGAGQFSQARYFHVTMEGGSIIWTDSTQTYSTSDIYPRQLGYSTTFTFWVTAFNSFGVSAPAYAWFGSAADPNAKPPGQQPGSPQQPGGPQPPGYSAMLFYNCSSLHYTIHFWTLDLTTNEWKDHGALDAQYDANGTCPGSGASPMQIDLADGHKYVWVVVAPDQQTCGGQNDPTLTNCVAWQGGPVVGSKKGPPLLLQPFVGA